jgi:hypothetical protein
LGRDQDRCHASIKDRQKSGLRFFAERVVTSTRSRPLKLPSDHPFEIAFKG